MFNKKTYIERRQRLQNDTANGIILLPGNEDSPKTYLDNTYPFRQDSTFLYFTGFSLPGLVLLLDTETGEEILFGDDIDIVHIVWTGVLPSISEQAAQSGIQKSGPLNALQEYLDRAKNKGRKIHFLPPYRAEHTLKLSDWLGLSPKQVQSKASVELIKNVVAQRNYKSSEEIVELERAIDISVDMHVAAMRMMRPGILESEVVAEITKIAMNGGGSSSFLPIATINGQTLHTHDHSNIVKEGQMFLLDAGAETAMGYCGDLSSTFSVGTSFTPEQREVYEICLASHNAAIDMLKPGVSFKDIYYHSARVILEGMKSMGIFKGNVEDGLVAGAHAMFFPCGLGHMLGLDVHDMEGLGELYVGWDGEERSSQFGVKSLRLGRKLEPGFVLTIEPGIYFIPELMDLWQEKKINSEFFNFDKLRSFKNFGGIRNEEDFLITEDGKRLLGKKKPTTISEIDNVRL